MGGGLPRHLSPPPNGPLTVFDLLDTLPPALRETHFLKLLTDNDAKMIAHSTLVDRFIKGLPLDAPMLSPAVAAKVVKLLKQRIHSGESRYDWQLRHSLVELACLLPAAATISRMAGTSPRRSPALCRGRRPHWHRARPAQTASTNQESKI